jgi:hypothetical protein
MLGNLRAGNMVQRIEGGNAAFLELELLCEIRLDSPLDGGCIRYDMKEASR